MTSRIPKLTGTAASAWLALAARWVPASAQDTSPLRATLPPAALGVREAQTQTTVHLRKASRASRTLFGTTLIANSDPIFARASRSPPGSPAFAETSPNPPERKRSEKERPISYGVELELRSGHADRGLVISDRPVVQSVAWMSGSVASFSVWSNLTLGETGDGSRPKILEMELTREHQWRKLTIGPAIRVFFYRDPLHGDRSRSIESWVYLSYDAGQFRLFTNHSVDALSTGAHTLERPESGSSGVGHKRSRSEARSTPDGLPRGSTKRMSASPNQRSIA